MTPEIAFWDKVGLGLALLFVVVFIILKLKKAFSSDAGCSGCSYSTGSCRPDSKLSCNKPGEEPSEQHVTVEKIKK